MSLKAFMAKLQEQDDKDVVYSKTPDDSIHVIPPENTFKVIPPETNTVIQFKLNKEEPKKPVKPIIQPKPKLEQPKPQLKLDEAEVLFRASGTAFSKKEKWLDLYEQAKKSKKQNSMVERMKIGKFAITQDDKVLILPKYDFKNKTTEDILRDKWLK